MDFVMLLLASSGVLQQPPPAPVALDSVRPSVAAVADARGDTVALLLPAVPEASPSAGPLAPAPWPRRSPEVLARDSASPQRPRAIEMSDLYHTRLTIHFIASFATLPLFVAEYLIGAKLYTNFPDTTSSGQSLRQTHRVVALGVAGLFAVNTVTGAWNLWDSRKQPEGAARRYIHAGLMFLADAGFVATGLTAPKGRRRFTSAPSARRLHRAIAIGSMGTALASYAMMLIWRN